MRSVRLTILGYPGVGKSAITTRYMRSEWQDLYRPTIEERFTRDDILFRRERLKLTVTDTMGQDELADFKDGYCVASDGYILVYSVESRVSFDVVKHINDRLLNLLIGSADPVRVLVANKSDIAGRQVTKEEGRALAAEWGCPFVECSAKVPLNVDKVFVQAFEEIAVHEKSERDDGGANGRRGYGGLCASCKPDALCSAPLRPCSPRVSGAAALLALLLALVAAAALLALGVVISAVPPFGGWIGYSCIAVAAGAFCTMLVSVYVSWTLCHLVQRDEDRQLLLPGGESGQGLPELDGAARSDVCIGVLSLLHILWALAVASLTVAYFLAPGGILEDAEEAQGGRYYFVQLALPSLGGAAALLLVLSAAAMDCVRRSRRTQRGDAAAALAAQGY